jgi:hypothetical protein
VIDISSYANDVGCGEPLARVARFADLHQLAMRAIGSRLLHVWQAIAKTGVPYQKLEGGWGAMWELCALVRDAEIDKRMRVLVVNAPASPLPFWLAAEGCQMTAMGRQEDACAAAAEIARRLDLNMDIVCADPANARMADESFHRLFVLRLGEEGCAGMDAAHGCGRLLSGGGLVAVSTGCGGQGPPLRRIVEEFAESSRLSILGPLPEEAAAPTPTLAVAFFARHGRSDLGIDRVLDAAALPLVGSDHR